MVCSAFPYGQAMLQISIKYPRDLNDSIGSLAYLGVVIWDL